MKDIIEYNGIYKVTEDARIYKDLGHHIVQIKPCMNSWGYLVFSMSFDGLRRMYRLHRVVAQYFVPNPNPEEFDQVNHLDGNKLNCAAWNLEWSNNLLNNQHKATIGLCRLKIPRIASDVKTNIANEHLAGVGPCIIARENGVAIHTVYRIIKQCNR